MNRLNWIDIAKGIGIVLVVIGHVGRGLVNSDIIADQDAYYALDNLIYSFHMPLFFLLSGYLAYAQLEKHRVKTFVVSKVDVIIYPYVIWSLIQGGIELVMSGYTNRTELDFGLLNIFQPHAQFWFLYWLFIFSVLLALTIVCRQYKRIFVASLMVLALISYLFQFGIAYFYSNFVYFLLGYLVASYQIKPQYHRLGLLLSLLFAVVVQVFANHRYDYSFEMQNYDLGSLAITLLSLVALIYLSLWIGCSRFTHHIARLLSYLGNISLPIYLMHIIFASGARIALQRFMHIDDVYLHWLIGMIAGLGFSIIADHLLKRLGFYFLFRAKFSHYLSR
jgi:fucose 4-O-acetylase-like acetyltransferase